MLDPILYRRHTQNEFIFASFAQTSAHNCCVLCVCTNDEQSHFTTVAINFKWLVLGLRMFVCVYYVYCVALVYTSLPPQKSQPMENESSDYSNIKHDRNENFAFIVYDTLVLLTNFREIFVVLTLVIRAEKFTIYLLT